MSSSSNFSASDADDGGRALPSFTPIRNVSRESDKPESSASGSRRSARSSTQEESPQDRENAYSHNYSEDISGITRTNGTVRRRPNSGGFLLDAALHPRRAFLSRSKQNKPDIKGKRPRDSSEIILPKRKSRDVRHEKSPSIGGSPLATEIKQDTDVEGNRADESLILGTDVRKSTFLQGASTYSPRYGSSLGQPQASHPVGYDTDPAQIVNMALSLNEKRRRQASGLRMVSGQIAGTRAVSGAVSPQVGLGAPFTTPTKPRFSSPTLESNEERGTSERHPQEQSFVGGAAALDEEANEMATSFPISQATETRVQKARTYFELAYEHRRLLSHLPPVRHSSSSMHQNHSKLYNPLQYSRNRKLRFSEKHPIAAEAEGWHDIDQVRAWVDIVIATHTDTRHNPDECIRLPDLAHNKAPDTEDEDDDDEDPMLLDSPTSSFRKLNAKKNAKPRRPRSDWVTYPGDMVADAYWLEQGQNKLKIVDRDGQKIYPPETRFKFSGWRNRTPIHVPERLQEPTPPPEQDEEGMTMPTPPPSALPELPTFTSTHNNPNRKRSKRKSAFSSKLGSGTQNGRGSVLFGIDSSSSDTGSDEEGSGRGRKRISRKRQKPPDVRDGESFKFKSSADHRSSGDHASSADHNFDQSANSSKRPSFDHSRLSKLFTRDSKTDSSKNASKTRSDSERRASTLDPPSRGSYDGGAAPRSSAEYDTTAPTSPTGAGFPSIAINLSPPASRSPSPSKKIIPSILNPFRDRGQSKVREGIEANDFGKTASREQSRLSSNEEPDHESSDHASRGTSPMTRGPSPMTKSVSRTPTVPEPQTADEHRGSTVSRISTKSTNTDGHSKVRGVFKGGRIAQLVGNEVSKVGDYIWKRDVPTSVRRRDSASSSLLSYHDSDSDEPSQNGFAYKTPPQHDKRFPAGEAERGKKLSPGDSHSSPDTPENVDPRYHNPNLPSFTSPFQRDRDAQDEKKKRSTLSPSQSQEDSKDQHDHISHLASQHRNATKSPRMDRLAPPKLNMSRSSSPGGLFSSIDYDRRSSYGFGSDRDFSKSRNASQVFNDALKTNGTMVTGLTSIDPAKSRSRSRVDLFRTLSHQSDRASNDAPEVMDVSQRDISFTSALLLSTAVKAREIASRAEAIREPMPAFLLNTINSGNELSTAQRPKVKRKEEHLVASRNLISRLERDGQKFQGKVRAFQNQLAPNLHRSLQELEDLLENGLTPRVRKSVDETGELSMKLSTTSTLAVKDVNERVEMAMRRRRRGPVRWLRRSAYLFIEWLVVGLLWGIWAIVSVLRVGRAVLVGIVRILRWLLFL